MFSNRSIYINSWWSIMQYKVLYFRQPTRLSDIIYLGIRKSVTHYFQHLYRTPKRVREASKQKAIITIYKWFFGTFVKFKKEYIYSMRQLVKILQTLSRYIQLFNMSRKPFLTCIVPPSPKPLLCFKSCKQMQKS